MIRPAQDSDYRGYAGQIASGALRPGEEVTALPSGGRTRIAAIDTFDGELKEALAPMSVTLLLEDELDISRGELICRAEQAPTVARELEADVCWMSEQPLRAGGRYLIKHTARHAEAIVDGLLRRAWTCTRSSAPLSPPPSSRSTTSAASACARSTPLVFDPYAANRRTGSFILIDEASNETVGAGMITAAAQ